jgi:predicted Zn-dependent peptidase
MEIHSCTLPNEIRLVHFPVKSHVSHCGLFVHAGSRDEAPEEHGLAHFIEHTIFKGTRKRSLLQVLNRLENVGADLNAFTTKEETCIYASFLNEYYSRTLELFSDIFFSSVFPEKEIEHEKQVVADEIRSYLDNPAEQIFDDFEDQVFAGHPLGRNILGTNRSLKKINRQSILTFIGRNYRMDEVVIASAGKIPFSRLRALAERYFSDGHARGPAFPRLPFTGYQPETRETRKKIAQVHCIIGGTAYAFNDERRIPLALLNNMLGGPVMNSRLSLALRERNGLTYHNESNYTAYSDSGIISIYFGTDPANYEKARTVVSRELRRIREEKLTSSQLHIIKKQLSGQLAIAQESNLALMLTLGKSYLLQNRYDPVEVILRRIHSTTAEELREIADEIFDEHRLSSLIYR